MYSYCSTTVSLGGEEAQAIQHTTPQALIDNVLREKDNLYRTLARNFPDGAVALFDDSLRYAIAEGAGLTAIGLSNDVLEGKTIWELFPPEVCALLEQPYRDALNGVASAFEVPFAGRVYHVRALPVRNHLGEIFAGMAIAQDITDRKRVDETLQRRDTILEAVSFAAERFLERTTAWEESIDEVLRRLGEATGVDRVYLFEAASDGAKGRPYHWVSSGGPARFGAPLREELLEDARGVWRWAESLRQGQSVHGPVRELPDGERAMLVAQGIHSVAVVPIFAGLEWWGAIRFDCTVERRWSTAEIEALKAAASILGAAVQRNRAEAVLREREDQHRTMLEHRVIERTGEIQRRRQVAESLREILAILNSRRPLKTILDSIAGQAIRLLDAAAIAIYRLEREEGVLRIQAAQGLDAHYAANMFIGVGHGAVGRTVVTRQPTVLSNTDLLNLDDAPEEFDPPRRALVEDLFRRYRALLAVPLIIKDEIYGGIVLYYTAPRQFTEDEIDLAVAFGDQAALAIENARLFAEAQAKAALEERQRLGRELHDSVSQALYGIALGARTARALLDRAPSEAIAPMDYVVSLAQGGLTDMRALIFELRPESLEVEGLCAGLHRQADSLRARHSVEVHVDLCEEPQLALDVKEALYRTAQEALHNAAKHARADRVELRLRSNSAFVQLEVCDNGIGFDPSGSFPGHLGLVSMRERAANVGGTLEIVSTPKQGTCICARVPAASTRE